MSPLLLMQMKLGFNCLAVTTKYFPPDVCQHHLKDKILKGHYFAKTCDLSLARLTEKKREKPVLPAHHAR